MCGHPAGRCGPRVVALLLASVHDVCLTPLWVCREIGTVSYVQRLFSTHSACGLRPKVPPVAQIKAAQHQTPPLLPNVGGMTGCVCQNSCRLVWCGTASTKPGEWTWHALCTQWPIGMTSRTSARSYIQRAVMNARCSSRGRVGLRVWRSLGMRGATYSTSLPRSEATSCGWRSPSYVGCFAQ